MRMRWAERGIPVRNMRSVLRDLVRKPEWKIPLERPIHTLGAGGRGIIFEWILKKQDKTV
jgi:hypothetical protein